MFRLSTGADMSDPRIEGYLSSPTFTLGEDETGGPCFYWKNPWSGEREKIASLWWPTHPMEATAEIEQLFAELHLSRRAVTE